MVISTIFPGRLGDDALPVYYAADVCVVPSHYEPFGLVAIEAMAGRQWLQVMWAVYSIQLYPNRLGYSPWDDLAFAAAIDRILSDPIYRNKLAGRSG